MVWGMFHGLFLVGERIAEEFGSKKPLINLSGQIYTMFFVMIGWVFFRSPDLDYARIFLYKMFFFDEGGVMIDVMRLVESHFARTALVLALIGMTPVVKNQAIRLMRKNKKLVTVCDFLLLLVLILALIRLSAETHNPFIYFQF